MFAFKLSSGPTVPGSSNAASGFSRLFGTISALSTRFSDWRMRTAAYDGLMSMDDRMLRDIGLSRAEIEAAVEGELRR